MIITQVTPERWKQAQAWELEVQKRIAAKGDDHNHWWFDRFGGYKVLRDKTFKNILEVGCGTVTNVRLILPFLRAWDELHLQDPLIEQYLKMRYASYNLLSLDADYHPEMLEDLSFRDGQFNLVVCINVLDHVQDAVRCMSQMRRVLAPGGVLVIGQDLSNAEDLERCPESWQDVGHPIKLDRAFFDKHLEGFEPLYDETLEREQGRNPKCHYATLLWIGQKHNELEISAERLDVIND